MRSSGSAPDVLPTARVERGVLSQATDLVLSGARGVPATAVGVERAAGEDKHRVNKNSAFSMSMISAYAGQPPRASYAAVRTKAEGQLGRVHRR